MDLHYLAVRNREFYCPGNFKRRTHCHLDEATSSVDPENEQALLSAIEELTKNKTLISIAHRLSTVQKADQIIVIDNGQIRQKGTHKQLSQEDGIYRNFLKLRVEATGWQL